MIILQLKILVTELIRAKLHENLAKIELQLFCCELPSWIIEAYRQIGIFVFGMLVCELATTIAKYSIGRYRPDFFNASISNKRVQFIAVLQCEPRA